MWRTLSLEDRTCVEEYIGSVRPCSKIPYLYSPAPNPDSCEYGQRGVGPYAEAEPEPEPEP